MALTKEDKEAIMRDFGQHEGDTGSPQVQIALLTNRIQYLTDHLKEHSHDEHSRRGLLMLVGRRRRLLKYLSKKDPESYQDMLKRLKLRR